MNIEMESIETPVQKHSWCSLCGNPMPKDDMKKLTITIGKTDDFNFSGHKECINLIDTARNNSLFDDVVNEYLTIRVNATHKLYNEIVSITKDMK